MRRVGMLTAAVVVAAGCAFAPAGAARAASEPSPAPQEALSWVGGQVDTTTDAPEGKTKVYRISAKDGTIRYQGARPRADTLTGVAGSAPLTVAPDTDAASLMAVAGPYNPPRSGDFIYGAAAVPDANYGFAGTSGTKSGTWYGRGYVASHNYPGAAAWVYEGAVRTTPHLGRNSTAYISGGSVTGISVALG